MLLDAEVLRNGRRVFHTVALSNDVRWSIKATWGALDQVICVSMANIILPPSAPTA